jgi:hypothetical protein
MLYVALIVGIVFVMGSLGLIAWIALKLFRSSAEIARVMTDAHGSTLQTLERVHERNMQQFQLMADRFMSLDFAQFKNYQLAESAEFGGLEEPDEGEVALEVYTPGGGVIPLGEVLRRRMEGEANEAALLAEDFPEGWDQQGSNR